MGGGGETAAEKVHAAFFRADKLREAGRAEDARAGYDAVVDDFGSYQGDNALYVRRMVAAALAFKALSYKDVESSQELDALNVVDSGRTPTPTSAAEWHRRSRGKERS